MMSEPLDISDAEAPDSFGMYLATKHFQQVSYRGAGKLSEAAIASIRDKSREEFSDLPATEMWATFQMIEREVENKWELVATLHEHGDNPDDPPDLRVRKIVQLNYLLQRYDIARAEVRSRAFGDPGDFLSNGEGRSSIEEDFQDLPVSEAEQYGTRHEVQLRRYKIHRLIGDPPPDSIPSERKESLADQFKKGIHTIESDLSKLREQFGN